MAGIVGCDGPGKIGLTFGGGDLGFRNSGSGRIGNRAGDCAEGLGARSGGKGAQAEGQQRSGIGETHENLQLSEIIPPDGVKGRKKKAKGKKQKAKGKSDQDGFAVFNLETAKRSARLLPFSSDSYIFSFASNLSLEWIISSQETVVWR